MSESSTAGHPLDPLYRALGRLVANFNQLEYSLAYFSWELINFDDQRVGQIVTAGMPFSQLLGVVEAVFKRHVLDVGQRERLADFLKKTRQVQEQRNRFVHASWGSYFGEPTPRLSRMKRGGYDGIQSWFDRVDVAEVEAAATGASEVSMAILEFASEVVSQVNARRAKAKQTAPSESPE